MSPSRIPNSLQKSSTQFGSRRKRFPTLDPGSPLDYIYYLFKVQITNLIIFILFFQYNIQVYCIYNRLLAQTKKCIIYLKFVIKITIHRLNHIFVCIEKYKFKIHVLILHWYTFKQYLQFLSWDLVQFTAKCSWQRLSQKI